MARMVFKDPKFFAEQIGLPEELVIGIHNLWIALSSKDTKLDPDKFHTYCQSVKRYKLHAKDFPNKGVDRASLKENYPISIV